MFDLTGKTALVTGASYGLGEVFAHTLADAGADLVLTARTEDLLGQVGDAITAKGRKATCITGDVAREDDVRRVVEDAIAAHGHVDILVNNAGISDLRGLGAEHYDAETFRRVIDVDLVGAFLFAREVGRHMLERGSGSVINICSIMAGGANELNIASYAAAKGGLLNLTQQLGCEWADRGVRVNAVSPGFIVTEMTRAPLEGMGLTRYIASRTPMRRVGEAREVAPAVLFLASDEASYITGTNMNVDGGTNAANGYYQVEPVHHHWNAETNPRVGSTYPGLVDQPDFLAQWRKGIPGLHPEAG